MRLIDATTFKMAMVMEAERNSSEWKWDDLGYWIRYRLFERVLKKQPTVDAAEVIHCEHCKHHENDSSSDPHWCFVWETFTDNHVYCSFAERRQDG